MIQFITNMRLAKRLAMSFGSLTIIALAIAAIAWWGVTSMNLAMEISKQEFGRTVQAKNMASIIDSIYLNIWTIASQKNAEDKKAGEAELTKSRTAYGNILEELKASDKSDKGQALLKKISDAILAAKEVNTQVTKLSSNSQEAEAIALFAKEGTVYRKAISAAVEDFLKWRQDQLEKYEKDSQNAVGRVKSILIVASFVAVLLAAVFGVLITRSIANPIQGAVGLLNNMSSGDLTQDVPKDLSERKDEAGDLARAMQNMTTSLRRLLGDITDGVETLATSSSELTTVSGKTATEVKSMAEKANMVAVAAEESSANTTSVAASMEQASTNLGNVAAATEEMSATVADIASNSEKARVISEQAIGQTQSISALMQQLGKAAQEIGKVTETINDISSQTNLLALNATIEAARAGAAGKGFAVVANEIKELARQTATATEDIKAKISGVQTSAGSAISDIEKIASVINDVGGIVANIAAAIEEQATVTKDVAGNIAQASTGVKEANTRVAQTATVSTSIAQDIATVNRAVTDVRQGGERVQASASELSLLAEQLKEVASQFKVNSSGRSAGARKDSNTLVAWKADFSTSVGEMDSQHKKLLDLINKFYAAMKRGEGASATSGILKELLQYTEFHFAEEEEMLEKVNYSDLAAQRKAHVAFVNKVKEGMRRWESGDTSVTPELMHLLANWLPQHILKMDKQYGPAVNSDK